MERFDSKPSLSAVFDALADPDTDPGWDENTLRQANPEDVLRIRSVLRKGLPLSEARIWVSYLEER